MQGTYGIASIRSVTLLQFHNSYHHVECIESSTSRNANFDTNQGAGAKNKKKKSLVWNPSICRAEKAMILPKHNVSMISTRYDENDIYNLN